MPLTDAQKTLHWSYTHGWAAVCRANRWPTSASCNRFADDARREACSEWHRKVWEFAETIARQQYRAVTADDLRKGCYMLALGSPKSLTQFNNADLDRVLVVFRLMIEPDDLGAVRDWLAYEAFDHARKEIAAGRPCALPDDPGERRRHMHTLHNVPEAVLRHLLHDRFGGQNLEDLSLRDLREFTTTIKNRRNYADRPAVPQPAHAHRGATNTQPTRSRSQRLVEEPF